MNALIAGAVNGVPTNRLAAQVDVGGRLRDKGLDLVLSAVVPTLTTAGTPYTAGDAVGGRNTVSGALRDAGVPGVIVGVEVTDLSNQKADLTLIFFKSAPSGAFADNDAVPALSGADAALVTGIVNVAAADYQTIGGVAFAQVECAWPCEGAANATDLYVVIATAGTPTYAAAGDLSVRVAVRQS